MNQDFWLNKRVFITGHTGFKGGWLCLWLTKLGASITGYALAPPTEPNLFSVAKVSQGITSITGDIRDVKTLSACMKEAQPEIVIHMAAQALVSDSYKDPINTYSTNVMGTVCLLEAVRQCSSVRAVVNVTSDKCYENREWHWGYRESDPLGGFDPYSNSKGCAELVTSAYLKSYFHANGHSEPMVGLASARSGNVVGGGDWASNRLVPDAMRAFETGTPLRVRNPNATRPWQHVLEPLRGYLLLAEMLYADPMRYGGAFNFGPHAYDSASVVEIVDVLARAWGEEAAWEVTEPTGVHEATQLRLDISKSAAELGWQPKLDLASAIVLSVAWHKAMLENRDMREMTLMQIRTYQESCGG